LPTFDLPRLACRCYEAERDRLQFGYLGLQTLYDRYFLHIDGRRIELPQIFFMRVAMGLALERDRPGSPRHRVLRPDFQLRFHVLHADLVQQRHPAFANCPPAT
jgi:ribonucleotide reductase alpha subunit